MKKFYLGLLVGIGIGVALYWIVTHRSYDEAFYFPEGFEGCSYVVYDLEGTPPLEIQDGAIQYRFDREGLVLTSSPQDFGWEGRDHSGMHKTSYMYVNEQGKKTSEIPNSEIGFVSLGSYAVNGRTQITRLSVPLKEKAEVCDLAYEELERKLDEKLGPN